MAQTSIEIQPARGPLHCTLRPPGSKSLTNRALVCAALADGTSLLTGALDSQDTRVMIDALTALGVNVSLDQPAHSIAVQGCGGRIPSRGADLYVANSGTTVRFLASILALAHGTFRLHGTARMHQRPIQDLLDALAQLAVRARSVSGNGCPPLVIEAGGLAGGQASVRGDVSSQFLSGLLLAAPYAEQPVELAVEGPLVSKPYVHMTRSVMAAFGVVVDTTDPTRLVILAPRHYQARSYQIETDASSASYLWAAAAVAGGQVTVSGLSRDSVQGDVAFCDALAKMGCTVNYGNGEITVSGGQLVGIDIDMNSISDTVQTLAAVALFAQGPTTIRGVAHIRHKESDRIGALATEIRKLGATVEERPDGLMIVPSTLRGASVDTYDDHRMAMSLALVGLKVKGVHINDPDCTAKTYPRFFADLATMSRQAT